MFKVGIIFLATDFYGILVLITVLIALLPFLLLVVLPIYLVLRYFWRKREKQNLANEIARDEIKVE